MIVGRRRRRRRMSGIFDDKIAMMMGVGVVPGPAGFV